MANKVRRGKTIPLAEMTDDMLREVYRSITLKRKVQLDLKGISREALIDAIEGLAPRFKPRVPKMRHRGVGAYARELLARVTGKTPEGFPRGMSYGTIVKKVKAKFPESQFDDMHVRWYATKMRADGRQVPVHRKRSSWRIR